ncbi:MAG: alanine--tRNA ligase [Caldithrix sp. RBG_13_44_9]|nr:MAG: alanine--tRNA ligase [Caldithrix sp. RBG_13_44_9]
MKKSNEIRTEFTNFFKNKGHTFVSSSPVIPTDDPTLLFTNAGMNQFKDVFLGVGTRPFKRAVNSQKCIRVSGKHNDLEEVGHDTYHHTFFEMLGNWSFGDYYKQEAIEWAWELITSYWELPKNNLWATIYLDDDEAEKCWQKYTDIVPSQILRFGAKDNFWEMGETGPCGPCSEIHIDLGEGYCNKMHLKGHVCQVNSGCSRFIELWNLVFIQFNRDESGNLHPLPFKHVDTGMGFERIVSVLQRVRSNYDTDIFQPIIQKVEDIAGINYNNCDESKQVAFRVLADHIRMLTFSITDGALPSNEGRGYVLRRILRRASRYARKLDLQKPFIFNLVPVVVEMMGSAFPEIREKQSYVMDVIRSEEENFNRTLDRGLEIFDSLAARISAGGNNLISGTDAFRLYDTFGFPLDLTRVMAAERGLQIDEEGFDQEMEIQRERARQSGKFSMQFDHVDQWNVLKHCSTNSHFVGYEKLAIETEICKFALKNDKYQIVLTETPFYAESGGQVPDVGKLLLDDIELPVVDVQKQGNEIIHFCEASAKLDIIHSKVSAQVDHSHRFLTMYNHTSTHLLHEALRRVLGKHVEQAGSLVSPDRLRFDFTHYKKIEREELFLIESIVNEQIRRNSPLDIFYTDFNKAKEMGARALFGEKYSDQVRVVIVDDFSKELCGGTHVSHTGQIGSFIILQETSIASGVRRIEAITGPRAVEFAQKSRDTLQEIGQVLNTSPDELIKKVINLNNQLRDTEKRLQKIFSEQAVQSVENIIDTAEKIGNLRLAIKLFQEVDIELLKQAADRFRQKNQNGVLLLISQSENRINFVCAVTDDLIHTGIKAGELVKVLAQVTGGGGGGRPHLATAGGKNPAKLEEAITSLREFLQQKQN